MKVENYKIGVQASKTMVVHWIEINKKTKEIITQFRIYNLPKEVEVKLNIIDNSLCVTLLNIKFDFDSEAIIPFISIVVDEDPYMPLYSGIHNLGYSNYKIVIPNGEMKNTKRGITYNSQDIQGMVLRPNLPLRPLEGEQLVGEVVEVYEPFVYDEDLVQTVLFKFSIDMMDYFETCINRFNIKNNYETVEIWNTKLDSYFRKPVITYKKKRSNIEK